MKEVRNNPGIKNSGFYTYSQDKDCLLYTSYSGFAFGIGIERIAMLKYGINNIGLMFENNLQFLKQFHE